MCRLLRTVMTRPCPTHPDTRDATHLSCWRCDAETATTDHQAGAALVRAAHRAVPRTTTPPDTDPARAAALERARKERR